MTSRKKILQTPKKQNACNYFFQVLLTSTQQVGNSCQQAELQTEREQMPISGDSSPLWTFIHQVMAEEEDVYSSCCCCCCCCCWSLLLVIAAVGHCCCCWSLLLLVIVVVGRCWPLLLKPSKGTHRPPTPMEEASKKANTLQTTTINDHNRLAQGVATKQQTQQRIQSLKRSRASCHLQQH